MRAEEQRVLKCILILLAAVAVQVSGSPAEKEPVPQASALTQAPLGLDLFVPVPPENRPTESVTALGQRLFMDNLLSADETLSCASCHRPDHAFADRTAFSRGVFNRQTRRNAPSLFNVAYGRSFFWDGRVSTLEEQVVRPIIDPNEMGLPLDAVVGRLRERTEYREQFRAAFGSEPTAENLAWALASFVRTLRSGNSAADRYSAGDPNALTRDARAGFRLFREKAGCVNCHIGPLLTDEDFHNTGVGWGNGDLGRFEVTGDPADRGKFNTPSLRNVALTAPYMHDGSMRTIEEVIDFYDGGANANPNLDREIRPLEFTEGEKHQLAAYLRSLTGFTP